MIRKQTIASAIAFHLAVVSFGASWQPAFARDTQEALAHFQDQKNAAQAIPERNANPCGQTENRQFDFWVGEWDVTSGGRKIAESSIQRIIGSCVIYENYSDPGGYTGKSFNFYDAVLKKWRQTWVDNGGNVSEFSGEYKDNAMHYEGESHRRDGQRFLRKMTVTRLDADRVRQYSEFSMDGGKSWKSNYDFLYLRKK